MIEIKNSKMKEMLAISRKYSANFVIVSQYSKKKKNQSLVIFKYRR